VLPRISAPHDPPNPLPARPALPRRPPSRAWRPSDDKPVR